MFESYRSDTNYEKQLLERKNQLNLKCTKFLDHVNHKQPVFEIPTGEAI
ncbi:MAG: hypothetical protein KZQ66_19545 [Candidatus Thiodiazotropha sp. (ex Lucinoma aequizonata)]|nr:hypothetical protein [Candidatus Thiodiazotropha sp. (ex Lucinoma aequizonata)]MCU7894638.1 hypothetical protein [Candidatus Thiodiazotropha sp. (ex Lucinoma aequizonata)]MCU7903897.1 hypothetical protein [Candidatus Thiodiazotropha sp. (ex Lucinoma aequizonata)]MCU7910894.1 hypothetical protein [Candidatus Thiodiazotropha sp. (ex Lucinoma aequizonata)]